MNRQEFYHASVERIKIEYDWDEIKLSEHITDIGRSAYYNNITYPSMIEIKKSYSIFYFIHSGIASYLEFEKIGDLYYFKDDEPILK